MKDKIIKIGIIGLGALGFRHFQALLELELKVKIYLIDIDDICLNKAKIEFKKHNKSNEKEIICFNKIQEVEDSLELIIVATNSLERPNILNTIIRNKISKNLILEKVVFNVTKDYKEFLVKFKTNNVNAWVNHPRRSYKFYQALKDRLKGMKINMQVTGGKWGLASNALHFIDLFCFLNSCESKINLSITPKAIYKSKRKGYSDFTGLITGQKKGNNFSLISNDNSSDVIICINSKPMLFEINETKGLFTIKNNYSGKSVEYHQEIIEFQSSLTSEYIRDFYEGRELKIPSYSDICENHSLFLESIDLIRNKNEFAIT